MMNFLKNLDAYIIFPSPPVGGEGQGEGGILPQVLMLYRLVPDHRPYPNNWSLALIPGPCYYD